MRLIGVGNLLQAALLAALTVWLAERWVPAAVLMGLAAALQLLAGPRPSPRGSPWCWSRCCWGWSATPRSTR
jgi:hypothetical protein